MKTRLAMIRSILGHRRVLLTLVLALGLLLLAGPVALGDVYGNISPAPQLPAGGLVGRYPIGNYQLDQYFPAIKAGLFSGVDVSGLGPMIACVIAQIIWLITAFLANGVITVFAFAFNLDLLNGGGTPGSGALAPVSQAVHNMYTDTFGAPWLIAAVLAAGCWAMWKALVQRRYTEAGGTLAISLLYCILALGVVTQPQRTIAPASQLSNELSTSLLSLSSQGNLLSETQAKQTSSDDLFRLLVLDPWTVLEFGGTEHCTATSQGATYSVPVRPLGGSPEQEATIANRLDITSEVHAGSKTCVNNELKYAPHFLAYPFQSPGRNSEHEALEHADNADLPNSDPGKSNGSYHLTAVDKPAAEAMGKGGQYERLLLTLVILAGEVGAFLLLGALAIGVIIAAAKVLVYLALSPVALIAGVIPGRGHEFFKAWLSKLAGYLLRKVIYSLILVLVLMVCQALDDAMSNLGWLMSFLVQAAFLWSVFLQRNELTGDLLAATAGRHTSRDTGVNRLQALYYTSRLTRLGALHRSHPATAPGRGRAHKPGRAPSKRKPPPPPAGGAPPPSPPPRPPPAGNPPPPPRPQPRPQPNVGHTPLPGPAGRHSPITRKPRRPHHEPANRNGRPADPPTRAARRMDTDLHRPPTPPQPAARDTQDPHGGPPRATR